jgi:hypothetical protein
MNAGPGTVWLSGPILTPLNKYVLPAVWLGAAAAAPAWVYRTTGRLYLPPGFRWPAAVFLASTVFLLWFSSKLQRVGYCARELVVTGWAAEAQIPFELVESVDAPWWLKRQVVRIRFRDMTAFGDTV